MLQVEYLNFQICNTDCSCTLTLLRYVPGHFHDRQSSTRSSLLIHIHYLPRQEYDMEINDGCLFCALALDVKTRAGRR